MAEQEEKTPSMRGEDARPDRGEPRLGMQAFRRLRDAVCLGHVRIQFSFPGIDPAYVHGHALDAIGYLAKGDRRAGHGVYSGLAGAEAVNCDRPSTEDEVRAPAENSSYLIVRRMADMQKQLEDVQLHDAVDHPSHYTSHPSGVECIQITEHLNFCLGNAIKYLWRAGLKEDAIEDLKKARWYVDRELQRLERGSS